MNKIYIYKLKQYSKCIFLILLILGLFIIFPQKCEAQERSFVYSTDLETILLQYTPEKVPEIKKDNTLVYVAIALVLLDVAIDRYNYRN